MTAPHGKLLVWSTPYHETRVPPRRCGRCSSCRSSTCSSRTASPVHTRADFEAALDRESVGRGRRYDRAVTRVPERPPSAAPRSRPDRPRLRPAARCRGARPRRVPVGRAPQPPVQLAYGESPYSLPDDAPDRAGDGAAASRRPQRHRGLLRRRLLVARDVLHALHRAGRGAPRAPTAAQAAAATMGMPSCVAERVTRPSGIEKRRSRAAA